MIDRLSQVPPVKEPDWYALTMNKYFPQFSSLLRKLYLSSVVKKLFELYALYNFPERLTDKLTKDINKSYLRKLLKMNRFEASRKIFYTSLVGNFFTYSSTLTVDVLLELVSYSLNFSTKRSWREIQTDVWGGVTWTSKKIVQSVVSCTGLAVGVSIGGYLSGSTFGTNVGGMLFELAFSGIGNVVLLLLQ